VPGFGSSNVGASGSNTFFNAFINQRSEMQKLLKKITFANIQTPSFLTSLLKKNERYFQSYSFDVNYKQIYQDNKSELCKGIQYGKSGILNIVIRKFLSNEEYKKDSTFKKLLQLHGLTNNNNELLEYLSDEELSLLYEKLKIILLDDNVKSVNQHITTEFITYLITKIKTMINLHNVLNNIFKKYNLENSEKDIIIQHFSSITGIVKKDENTKLVVVSEIKDEYVKYVQNYIARFAKKDNRYLSNIFLKLEPKDVLQQLKINPSNVSDKPSRSFNGGKSRRRSRRNKRKSSKRRNKYI
jgi:hypothetical protein